MKKNFQGTQIHWMDCLLIYAATVLSTYLLSVLILKPIFNSEPLVSMAMMFFMHTAIMLGLSLLFVLKIRKNNIRDALMIKPISKGVVMKSAFYGVALFFVMLIIAAVLNQLLPTGLPKQSAALFFELEPRNAAFILSVFLMGIMAPFAEEVLFRGYLFNALLPGLGVHANMVVTSLIFGMAHGDFYRMIPLAVGGYLLNRIAWQEQSILASVIAHGVWNICMVFAAFSVAPVNA